MEVLHIIYIGKNGGMVRTIADEASFEKVYKPKGWQIDRHFHDEPIDIETETIKELKTEEKIKNYKKMRNTKPQPFDDGLVKKE